MASIHGAWRHQNPFEPQYRPRPVASPRAPAPAEQELDQRELDATPTPASPPAADKDTLRRALRDLEAAESRVQRQAERVYDETRAKLVSDLLPVLDNLDRTLRAAHASNDASDRALLDGVKMTRAQLEQVLLRYGVERIDADGQRFDPAIHDAIATRPTDPEQVGFVVQPIEAGYRFAGRLLRAAKVIVGVAEPDE